MPRSKSISRFSTADVCRTYYETQVFGPGGAGDLSDLGIFTKARIDLQQHDVSFDGIDDETFTSELVAANIELYGLAWIKHQIESDAESRDLSTDEIAFTKSYLIHVGREDIWERMGAYNDSLAATTADSIVSENWGRIRDYLDPTDDEGYKQQRDSELIRMATALVDEFARHLADGECVKRLMVRFLTWSHDDIQRITHVTQNISRVLAERLGRDPNLAGMFALQRVVVGLYENAVVYLDRVREYGSHEAARSAHIDLLNALVRWAAGRQSRKDP